MRIPLLIPIALLSLTAAGATLLCCNGCAVVNSTNGGNADEIPDDEGEIQVVGQAQPEAPAPQAPPPVETAEPAEPAPTVVAPLAGLDASPFTKLQVRGVRGGELAYEIEGTVEQVAAMLMDQAGADGHRAWARKYREISREGDRVVGEWSFRGKMGINPVVQIEFVRAREGDAIDIDYKVVKRALGIKSFFGDYRVDPVPGVPTRSRLKARVFIDSGMPFVNASHQDMEDGLREDAKLMREWMEQRAGSSGGSSKR